MGTVLAHESISKYGEFNIKIINNKIENQMKEIKKKWNKIKRQYDNSNNNSIQKLPNSDRLSSLVGLSVYFREYWKYVAYTLYSREYSCE